MPLGVRPWGKLKMAVMSVAVPLAILRVPGAGWLLVLASPLTVASAWPYLVLAGAVLKGDPLEGGIVGHLIDRLGYNRALSCEGSFGAPCPGRPAVRTATRTSRRMSGFAVPTAGR